MAFRQQAALKRWRHALRALRARVGLAAFQAGFDAGYVWAGPGQEPQPSAPMYGRRAWRRGFTQGRRMARWEESQLDPPDAL